MKRRVTTLVLALLILSCGAAYATGDWIAVDIESPLEITPDWNEPDSDLLAMARDDGLIHFEDINAPLQEFLHWRARCIFDTIRPSQLMQRLAWVQDLDLSQYEGTITDERWLWMFENLTSIKLAGATFTDLDIIGEFPLLEELTLLNCGFFDLTPLTNCPDLTTLAIGWDDEYMGASGDFDLTPLKQLKELTTLELYGSGITSIEPLKSIARRFRTLTLSATEIEDITPLSSFSNLNALTLDLLQSATAAEIMLAVPKGIRLLTLNRIILNEDAETAAKRFNRLTDLTLTDCDVSNPLFYETLCKASRLTLQSISMSDGTMIGEVYADKSSAILQETPEAVMIYVLENRSSNTSKLVIDIEEMTKDLGDVLREKTSLNTLTVNLLADLDLTSDLWKRVTGISTLTISSKGKTLLSTDFLSNLTRVQTLTLSGVAIEKTAGIGELSRLTQLNVYGCRIADWSFLKKLSHLTTLKVYASELESDALPYFTALPALEDLRLNGNNITDISDLVTSTTIRKLDILDNPIGSYAPLLMMPALRTVYLDKGGTITNNKILARSVYIDDVDYETIYQEAFGTAEGSNGE